MSETALTQGVHHVGLTVGDLAATVAFFTQALGYREVGGRPDYPSVFVSDGTTMLTLWQARTDTPNAFDRQTNIGLHHLCLRMSSDAALDTAFAQVSAHPRVTVEFAPMPVANGNGRYAMVFEPSGNRIELRFMEG